MTDPQPRGLPPRIAVPLFLGIGGVFVALLVYFVWLGYGNNGSVFGAGGPATARRPAAATNVQGGPPPAVAAQVQALRARIAAHPDDDVAATQLGDMYLAVGKYAQAIPLYRQALRANPKNVAAAAGLSQATDGLAAQNS